MTVQAFENKWIINRCNTTYGSGTNPNFWVVKDQN